MRLVDLIRHETGKDFSKIMLLRHFNTIDSLVARGGTVDEFTRLQPTGSKYDYWANDRPRIDVVVVIVHDHVDNVYRVNGIEAEGSVYSLASNAHRQFDIERGKKDRPARRFDMSQLPSSVIGASIIGWKGKEINPTARSDGKLFWQIEVNLPLGVFLTEEIDDSEKLHEGSVCRVTVNAYERNLMARSRCIAHYGPVCAVCGFSFGAVYGLLAEGFIHVHHLKPLSEIGEEYEVDPIADLKPVCPNCHAVIHLGGISRSIEEVKRLMRGIRKNN